VVGGEGLETPDFLGVNVTPAVSGGVAGCRIEREVAFPLGMSCLRVVTCYG
jgi:hypothetical protein